MVRQDSPTDTRAVRGRLQERLHEKGMSARALALLTGDPPKNVQRYVRDDGGGTDTIPADFIGRCQARGFASAAWLLTGDEPRDVVGPSAEQAAFRQVAAIVDRVRAESKAAAAKAAKLEAGQTSEVDSDAAPQPRIPEKRKRKTTEG